MDNFKKNILLFVVICTTSFLFSCKVQDDGEAPGESSRAPDCEDCYAPDSPYPFTLAATATSVTISFPEPSDGGSPITQYTVTISPGGQTVTASTLPITVTGLTARTAYTFSVTAANAIGTSAAEVTDEVLTQDPINRFYSFTTSNSQYESRSPITIVNDVIYSMTSNGGANGYGSIFKANLDGTNPVTLHDFNQADGSIPFSSVIVSNGVVYGTTFFGGNADMGTVFKVNTDGSNFAVLKHFSENGNLDGNFPSGKIVLIGNTLYGTTEEGFHSAPGNQNGTAFAINIDGSNFTTLHTFNNVSGCVPYDGLTLYNGELYGTTNQCGTDDSFGTVFKLQTNGTYSTLYEFTGGINDGASPLGGVTIYNNKAYVVTSEGGFGDGYTPGSGSGNGTIMRFNLDGTSPELLYRFAADNSEGYLSYGQIVISNGVIYGSNESGGHNDSGLLYSINIDGSNFNLRYQFGEASGYYGFPHGATPVVYNSEVYGVQIGSPSYIFKY